MELFLMPISDAHLYFSVQVNQVNDLFNTQILVVDYDIDNNLFLTSPMVIDDTFPCPIVPLTLKNITARLKLKKIDLHN